MRIAAWIAAVLVLGAAGFAAWVRLAPDDPSRWHVDPLSGPFSGAPNKFLASPAPVGGLAAGSQMRAPTFAMTPEQLAETLDAVAMSEPRVERLAGSAADGHITYVQRSAIMRFPDYISVRVMPEGEGASLAIYSRSRYGYSDMGVNEARVRRWLGRLAPDG